VKYGEYLLIKTREDQANSDYKKGKRTKNPLQDSIGTYVREETPERKGGQGTRGEDYEGGSKTRKSVPLLHVSTGWSETLRRRGGWGMIFLHYKCRERVRGRKTA